MQRKSATRLPLQWDDVRLFLALQRARTLGEAAASLGVDASTASRRLAQLERAVAATLFERGRAGLAPTRAAEDLLPVAEEIEAAMARFSSAADSLEHDVRGSVRITCPSDVAEVALVPLLPRLLARHPALSIDLDATEQMRDLARREADIALRIVRPARGDLVVTRLLSVRWVVAANPTVAESLGILRAFADAPWLGFGERLGASPPGRWLGKHVSASAPRVFSDSLSLLFALLRAGAGVALVPVPSVAAYGLVPVRLSKQLQSATDELPTLELYAVCHGAARRIPRIRVVWEHLLERLGGR